MSEVEQTPSAAPGIARALAEATVSAAGVQRLHLVARDIGVGLDTDRPGLAPDAQLLYAAACIFVDDAFGPLLQRADRFGRAGCDGCARWAGGTRCAALRQGSRGGQYTGHQQGSRGGACQTARAGNRGSGECCAHDPIVGNVQAMWLRAEARTM